jgi:hypothetical protein
MRGVIFLVLVMAIACLKVNAISVSSDYLVNDTMVLIESTSKIYKIVLQNPTNYEIGMKLDYEKTFIKVIDYKEVYILPPKEMYTVQFNVTAPEEIGVYTIGYTVSEVEPGGFGGVPIRLKINRNFKLNVVKNPDKFYINNDYVAYAVIILIFLLYIIKKKYAKKRTRQKNKKFL